MKPWHGILSIMFILTLPLTGCMPSSGDESWETEYESLLLEHSILKAELETTQADVTYLQDASETLRDDYDTLKVEYNTLEADHITLKATSKNLQADYDARKADYDTLKDDYDALKALYDDVSNELAEIKKSSPPTPTQPEEEQIIEDLAYIKIITIGYSDDADPEYDGIRLGITFYDSKSRRIAFQDIIPVTVSINLFGYRNEVDWSWGKNRELVYQEEFLVDIPATDSTGLSFSLWDIEIKKIPHEIIMVDQNKYYREGTIEVTVATPKQGSFQASWGLVLLYDEK